MSPKPVVKSVALPAEMHEKVLAYAAIMGISPSAVVREAVDRKIDEVVEHDSFPQVAQNYLDKVTRDINLLTNG